MKGSGGKDDDRLIGRILRGVRTRLQNAFRVYILRDPVAIAQHDWFKDGREMLRYEYALDSSSIVFDLGGYHGDWAAGISGRFGSKIFIFEPVYQYFDIIRRRFEGNPKIRTFNFGLASSDQDVKISVGENSSSIHRVVGQVSETILLKDVIQFMSSENVTRVDLIKINIEGGEYDLLRRMVDAGIILKFKDVQVQFHDFVEGAEQKRELIRRDLRKTHELTYDYPFVWENWRRRRAFDASL